MNDVLYTYCTKTHASTSAHTQTHTLKLNKM